MNLAVEQKILQKGSEYEKKKKKNLTSHDSERLSFQIQKTEDLAQSSALIDKN